METQKNKKDPFRSHKEIDILKSLKKFASKHNAMRKDQEYERYGHEISFKNLFSTSTFLKQELGTAYFNHRTTQDTDFYNYTPPKPPATERKKNLEEETRNYQESFLGNVYSEMKGDEDDLISLITEQMLLAERELQVTRMHLIETNNKLNERDVEILRLKEKIKALQRSAVRGSSANEKNEEGERGREISRDHQALTGALRKLKKQVKDMEEFLNDYGLVWIGDDESDCELDFDKIVQNFQRLNSVACQPKITQTPSGAKFELPREIPLVLYSNGFLLRGTDFREYTRTSTKLFLLDVEDGYFPSELQAEYPEGVPFQVVDKRFEVYKSPKDEKSFQSQGNRLGSAIEKFRSSETKRTSSLSKFQKSLVDVTNNTNKNKRADDTLKLKIRLEESTEEFVLEIPRHQKMHVLQRLLSEKFCETALENNTNSYSLVAGSMDFKLHVYGRNSFRLSECLNAYPEECGLVNNSVVNVTALKSST